MFGVLDIPVTPEQIEAWFLRQSALVQILVAVVLPLVVGSVVAWRSRGAWDSNRITHWKELVREYKDRLEGASPADAAKQVEDLRRQVERLGKELAETKQTVAGQHRRRLSEAQREILLRACRDDLKEHASDGAFHFGVFYNSWNAEAGEYAQQLCGVFSQAGMSGVPSATNDVPRKLPGIVIRIKSGYHIPDRAKRLQALFGKAMIGTEIRVLYDHRTPLFKADYVEVVVGRNVDVQRDLEENLEELRAKDAES